MMGHSSAAMMKLYRNTASGRSSGVSKTFGGELEILETDEAAQLLEKNGAAYENRTHA